MYKGLRKLISQKPSYSLNLFNFKTMSTLEGKFELLPKYKGLEKTIWGEFNALAAEHKPLNLGQGFPDFAPPSHVTQALADVAKDDNILLHQYCRGYGHVRLVNALSKVYSKMTGHDINPMTDIITTAGAYESLYCAILGLVNAGDEVILIEPFFDCYEPMVAAANGKPVFVPLRMTKKNGTIMSSDWKLDEDELSCAFSSKTKLILLNTPHNPVGKVFSMEELTMIADLCKKWNVVCISDEVYEWMVYKPYKHVRIATLPGMWERTITIGSAGKTLSVTGWKTGWAYGPANLIHNLQVVHQNILNSITTPISEAIARSLELELSRIDSPDCYFVSLAEELREKRDYMAKFITEIGMIPTIPEGGYFMMVDWTPLADRVALDQENDKYKDYKFAKWMTKNQKLQGIPPSAFYGTEHKNLGENYIRYCFIKKDENLQKAEQILKKWACGASKM
ncbi:kynurenine--oxoglutarate transaminase 3 isoform X2 [Cimex lectularius]|uniref:Aminotransferase class I/classII large domain-containing protein n=1 Tax=Cimex lectularius TaxID=79782 RepID=A0A8I6RP39_CIMLE|nr:kynurenine--oxoglutarate transaminase 3 isoform X2 [Cimex lectularius]XP_014248931.1 kynurenine--oxoglutarate transaminase 3 isoform X2 [Cimex lectularius]